MKFIQYILAILVVVLAICSCSTNYGHEYKLNKDHSVYYKGDGMHEAEAKKLADYLKYMEYFRDSTSSAVQIIKTNDSIHINFVVDETKLINGYENSFLLLGGFIPDSIFNKAPVNIQLTNNQLEPFKNLGYATPINAETIK